MNRAGLLTTAAAVLAALLFYAALKWLDRKVPNRPRVARVVTAPRHPQPRGIRWAELTHAQIAAMPVLRARAARSGARRGKRG